MRSYSPFGPRGPSYTPAQLLLIGVVVLVGLIIYSRATGAGGSPTGLLRAARELAILFPALILSLAFHELAHAWVANALGDDTARRQGRLTIDPRAHLDPVGTFMLIFTLIFGFGIGWAKPVPVNPWRLRIGARPGMALVAFAGPLANLVLAFIAIQLFQVIPDLRGADFVPEVLERFAVLNVVLAVFNMIPIPPLDGFRVLMGILPGPAASSLSALEQYGPMILLMVVFFFQGVIQSVIFFAAVPILRALGAA